jgi:uncharacterized phage-associated protein
MDKSIKLNKTQLLLYSLIKLNDGVDDKITLAKLEYLADFIHYAFHSKPISEESLVYTRQDYGPLARTLSEDIEYLKKVRLIKEDKQYNYEVDKEVDLKLSKEELKTIQFVLSKYGKTSWKDLERISHGQAPYMSTNPGGVIEYFTAYNLIDEYPDYESFSISVS